MDAQQPTTPRPRLLEKQGYRAPCNTRPKTLLARWFQSWAGYADAKRIPNCAGLRPGQFVVNVFVLEHYLRLRGVIN